MVIPHGRIDYDDQRTHNKGYQAFKITIFKDLNHGDPKKIDKHDLNGAHQNNIFKDLNHGYH